MTGESGTPPPVQRGRVDWSDVVARLMEHPNETILLEEFRQVDRARYLAQTVRQQASPALRQPDGQVVANIRNGGQGTAPGDLYLTWVPTQESEEE